MVNKVEYIVAYWHFDDFAIFRATSDFF